MWSIVVAVNREFDALEQLAREMGVLTSYIDWQGQPRQADPDVLVRVLSLLGAEIQKVSDAPAAVVACQRQARQRLTQACSVSWDHDDAWIELALPLAHSGRYSIELVLESGEARRVDGQVGALPVHRMVGDGTAGKARTPERSHDGDEKMAVRMARMPLGEHGYHQATVHADGRSEVCRILAAPRLACPVPMGKTWGVFSPLYALHSARSGGTGDLAELAELARRTGKLGSRFVGTLPLLSSYLDEPFEFSPYSPVSRLFWNEIYLDLESAPGFAACAVARDLVAAPGYAEQARALREQPLVAYREEMARKRAVLEKLAESAWQSTELRAAMTEYAARHPRVEEYARFRAKTERHRLVWTQWPDAALRSIAETDYDDRVRRYHQYVQFAMDAELAAFAGSTGQWLYLDLPVGVNRCGYDTWKERDLFILAASAGAPPDALFLAGQDWGLAPLHPERLRESGYAYLIDCVRHHAEHAGLLRVDHVMGLHRLYWVPDGVSARDGVYVQYHANEMYAILCLESRRHACAIVGEDLGTVPDYVPPAMREHGFLGLHVGQFGMRADDASHPDSARVPRDVAASLNTHDMATFAGFWQGRDIAVRQRLGLVTDEEAETERAERVVLRGETAEFLRQRGFLVSSPGGQEKEYDQDPGHGDDDELLALMRAVTLYLAASDARMMLVNLEDLWLENEPQNVPGTMGPDWSNWRRKLTRSLDDFLADERVLDILRAVDRARSS